MYTRNAGGAWAVSLNEICAADSANILYRTGMQGQMVKSDYAGALTSCSAHLTTTISKAQTQANEYLLYSTQFANGRHNWLAGDFNLQPGSVPSSFPADHGDGISGFAATYNTHGTLNRHIDYIWVSSRSGPPWWPATGSRLWSGVAFGEVDGQADLMLYCGVDQGDGRR